ncbi:MAG: glycosyltransferase [Bacteroidetes bacterium]|nr:glycosyltransferase [Bacteroidota bacterium]
MGDIKKIALIVPSLNIGGMERVMVELAWYFSTKSNIKITLILLSNKTKYYELPNSLVLIQPEFDYKKYSRVVFTLKIFLYLRKALKELKPNSLLSFSERYNAFVLLAAIGLGIKLYVSNRASPFYSAGRMIDLINFYTYRMASGIIAQTNLAKEQLFKKSNHKNIIVIGNPIRSIAQSGTQKENIILYVGRFSDQKNQYSLVEYFAAINNMNWVIKFVGDGLKMQQTISKVEKLGLTEYVQFEGMRTDIEFFYNQASIFAFTSLSEGFPNALGEAMAAGLACISYDCVAGPADLIDDGVNGFLIPLGNEKLYIERLKLLMEDADLRKRFGIAAREKMKQFSADKIAQQYLDFILA